MVLGTLNIRCRIITGIQKGTIILTSTHKPSEGTALYGHNGLREAAGNDVHAVTVLSRSYRLLEVKAWYPARLLKNEVFRPRYGAQVLTHDECLLLLFLLSSMPLPLPLLQQQMLLAGAAARRPYPPLLLHPIRKACSTAKCSQLRRRTQAGLDLGLNHEALLGLIKLVQGVHPKKARSQACNLPALSTQEAWKRAKLLALSLNHYIHPLPSQTTSNPVSLQGGILATREQQKPSLPAVGLGEDMSGACR